MQIYILRHGIAEDAKSGGSDAERRLTDEGKEKLRRVLKRARDAGVSPSLIVTSPLVRAVETAELAAVVLGYKDKLLRTKALEPGATPEQAWDEIRTHKDETELLLAGHEPLFSQLAAYLLRSPGLQVDMKKGALVRIDVDNFGAEPRGVLKWMLTPRVV